VDLADRGDQLVRGQRARGGLDVITVLGQPRDRIGMNILQEQDIDLSIRASQREYPLRFLRLSVSLLAGPARPSPAYAAATADRPGRSS
jgi:hypothetical protein